MKTSYENELLSGYNIVNLPRQGKITFALMTLVPCNWHDLNGNSRVNRVYVNYVLWFLSFDPAKTNWHFFFGTQIRFKRISDREIKHICAI